MKKSILFAIIGAFALSSLTGCLGSRGGGYGGHHHNFTKDLALNETQESKYEALEDAMIDKFKSFRDDDSREQLLSLLDTEKLDETKAKKILDTKAAKMQENNEFLIKKIAEFTNSLTSEQRAKLKKYMKKRRHGSPFRHGWH